MMSNYLRRMRETELDLILERGEIWCEQAQKSLQSSSFSEAWIEGNFTQEQFEKFKQEVKQRLISLRPKGTEYP